MVYRLRKDVIADETGKKYLVFGIEVVDCFSTLVQSIPDVFFSLEEAENFIHLCNAEGLEPIHLINVIEDAII